jgi:NADPH:quinone reductase-like Zn-dependent oxidoreductase
MRQIWIPKAGPPEVLSLREAKDPEPGRDEVRIRVEASGVNFADIVGRLGMYPDLPPMPVVPGYEVAGRIDAAGEEVDPEWLGRNVLALTRFGGYSDVLCVPSAQVFARPEGMNAEVGAAIPVNYLTAYQLVVVMGGLRAGETMLVHSAGGGVGIAAIQLARRIGARIIGTASAAKHDFLKGIGADHCIDYTRDDFETKTREITDGRGVELILDAVGGASFTKSYRALAPSGRLGMFGASAVVTGERRSIASAVRTMASMPWFRFTPIALMNENKGVFGVNLGHLWNEVDRIGSWMETLLAEYRAGAIAPVVAQTFALADAADAHRYIQERKNIGKVLLLP